MNNLKKAEARQGTIREILLNKELVTVHEFCEILGASEATIRNDLRYLESQNLIKRVLGGAMSTEGTPRNTTLHLRSSLNKEAKEAIANYIVKNILDNGMTITLDAGSTCLCIAEAISKAGINCNIITNSAAIAQTFEKSETVRLYLVGGYYDKEHGSYYDISTLEAIQSLYSDIYFLSPNGIDSDAHITSSASNEHIVKMAFLKQAKKIIVVGDHSKIGCCAFRVLCHLEDIACIITDSKADVNKIKELTTKVLVHLA